MANLKHVHLKIKSLKTTVVATLFFALSACDNIDNEPIQNEQTLDFNNFATFVNPVLDVVINGKACTSSGCHQMTTGKGGRLKLNPNVQDVNSIEMMQNYLAAMSFVNLDRPEASALLLEPLAGNYSTTGSHGGGDQFANTDDDNYLLIYQWIANPIDSDG